MADYTWITDDVFTVAGFLTPAECRVYIELSESLGFGEAPINTSMGEVRVPEYRNNQRVMLDDVVRAEELWERVRPFAPMKLGAWNAIGVNERLRFYRYDVGQQFNWHHDGYFARKNGQRSHLTFMVYLNEGFEGGETHFGDLENVPALDDGKVVPKTGLALVFSHPLLHKGEMVRSGRKYVLRTDVMYEMKEQ